MLPYAILLKIIDWLAQDKALQLNHDDRSLLARCLGNLGNPVAVIEWQTPDQQLLVVGTGQLRPESFDPVTSPPLIIGQRLVPGTATEQTVRRKLAKENFGDGRISSQQVGAFFRRRTDHAPENISQTIVGVPIASRAPIPVEASNKFMMMPDTDWVSSQFRGWYNLDRAEPGNHLIRLSSRHTLWLFTCLADNAWKVSVIPHASWLKPELPWIMYGACLKNQN